MTNMSHRDIAVVGMGCVFPGAEDLTQFWRNLVNGISAPATLSAHASDMAGVGCISLTQKAKDAQHLLRDTVQQALRDAGIAPGDKLLSRTQLILGQGGRLRGTWQQSADYELAGYLARELGLEGGACDSEDTADCSLRALEWGVQALREGLCDAIVFAAIHLPDGDGGGESFTRADIGYVRPPDRCAGTSVEGMAAVVLKRRTDAETEGDSAYAFIKGIATTPEGELHQAYTDAAVTPEGIGLLEIQDGDGLLADNSKELDLIRKLFGSRSKQALRPMGAIHHRIGQPGAVLGLASLIKAALCLTNKLIPPTLHGQTPSAALYELPFYLNIEPRPWIHDVSLPPRRAAVIAIDTAGGATHVILEEITDERGSSRVLPRHIKTELAWDSELVALSAETPSDLATHADQLIAFLQFDRSASLADIAYTQCLRFDPRAMCRIAIVCSNPDELRRHLVLCRSRLQAPSPSFTDIEAVYFSSNGNHRPGKIAVVFPGYGFPDLLSSHADLMLDLCLRFPEVRAAFDLADVRDGRPEDPTPTNQLFFPPAAFSERKRNRLRQRLASPRLDDAERMQIPEERNLSSLGIFIANWGSWSLLEKLGVSADMIFGHSLGELSALCAAGTLDYLGVLPIHWRAEYDPEEFIKDNGRLALVAASEERLSPLLKGFADVTIALHVTPQLQILGGERSQLKGLIDEVRKSETWWTRFLPHPAIHTPRFTLLRSAIEAFLRSLPIHPFRIPVYSGTMCDVYPDGLDAVPDIMAANLDHPALLWQTTRKMYRDGARTFVQVGGGATMYTPKASASIGVDDVTAVSLEVNRRQAIPRLNHLCAGLMTNGVTLNLLHLFKHRSLKPLNIDVTEAEVAGNGECPESFQDSPLSWDEPRMPFIGKCMHYIEGREIVIERILDLSEDLFLAHHLFIYAEAIKPVSARSPVMPMTVSMELMSEVAAYLAPGCGLLGFEDIKAMRWIELVHTNTLTLRISANLLHCDEATGIYRIVVGVFIEQEDTPAIQGMVLFGKRYLINLDLNFSPLQNPFPYPKSPKQIYVEERQLFHGPIFRCISGDTLLDERAVVGELTVLSKAGMFASNRRPELLTDPVVLDGVGQLIGLWAIDKGVYLFPTGIRRLELYCPTPEAGTLLPVHIEITRYSSRFLYANAEIQDGAGHVWTRIQGWGDWLFHWSKKVYSFRCQPTRHCVSHDLALPCLPEGAVAQRIARVDLRDSDSSTMLHNIAGFYLHMDEMSDFWRLENVPQRQLQWLMGRIAAKDAVRRWLAGDTDTEMLHPAAFIIENDEKGQPVVKNIPKGQAVPRLSIALSGDRAVALAHSDAVGVDIELIAERDARSLETITTRRERELLARFVGSENNAWTTRFWCAKEAVGKLMGTGVDAAPQAFEATDITSAGAITIFHHRSARSVSVNTKHKEDFMIAYTAEAVGSIETSDACAADSV